MSVLFEGRIIRRHTQHWLEDDKVTTGWWSSLSSRWRHSAKSKHGDVEMSCADPDTAHNVDAREDLYRIMVSNRLPDEVLNLCWRWFLSHMDLQIKELWNSVLAPIMQDLPDQFALASHAELARIYEVVRIIASTISRGTESGADTEITVDNMTDELMSHPDNFFRPTVGKKHVRQMVWCLAGPLTMLFDPKSANPSFGQLQLRRPRSIRVARGRHRGMVITSFTQSVTVAEDPFYQMLTQFGDMFPEVRRGQDTEICCHAFDSTNRRHFYPSHISFDVLKTVANLNIEWVNTLNLHLQLDERKRILRLYRFPAFCRLLYADGIDENGEPNSGDSFLCQIFNHHKASRVQGQPQERDSLTFHDFLRDMILSYRILFGMKDKSRKAFRDEMENWQLDKLHDGPISGQRIYDMDPLLWLLCTGSAQSLELEKLLKLLDGEETSSRYSFEDFPFLGPRLLTLQTFMEGHKPTGFWPLLRDRRDAQNWWIAWTAGAVLLIGGGTIVLQFWQLVFQIMSTFYRNGGG